MDVRTESNFSSDAEERGARHEARAAVQMAQDLRQRVEQGELRTQENMQQLQAALQQQQWLMGQQLGAMAANFQNFAARFDRFEKRKAASAMRPQKRERDAARHAAAAAAAASSSESFEPPRRTRGASADLAHQQRAQAAGEQNAALKEQLAAAQQAGAAAEARAAAAEARAADAVGRAAAEEARAADAAARAAAAEEEAQHAQRAAERRAVAAEALALAAQARQSAAEEEAAAARGKAQEAEASLAAAVASHARAVQAAEARAVAAEQVAANQEAAATSARTQMQGAQQAAAALSTEKAAAELRATTAEARATAAETATAEALAEVQRVREDEARQQAECESLRAALQGIREAGGCPISHGLPRDPVVASDGQTYDRRAILPWLRDHGTSPLTREPLQPQLHPNRFAAAVLRQLGEIGLGSTADGEDAESSAQSQNPQDAGDPEPNALINAIRRGDEAAALALLQRPGPLPGLNDFYDGAPVLVPAFIAGPPFFRVILAILARQDFSLVNLRDNNGSTWLHGAAGGGCLPMCQAILAREDFTEVLAISTDSDWAGLASEVARRQGHLEVAAFLENAEAQARRVLRA